MSEVDATSHERRRQPGSMVLSLSAVLIGIVCTFAGWIGGGVLLYSMLGGLPVALVTGVLVVGMLGLVVGGTDALVTGRPGAAGRATIVVLAVVAVLAAMIVIDLTASGGYPTGWSTLPLVAGATGLGSSLVLTRRTAPTVTGVIALLIVGGVIVGLLQQATADNVFPPGAGLV